MAAAALPNELVEAFLLRLPPDDPASLVGAALVCKLWRRVLADRSFRRRFCELHRRLPMLGFLAFLSMEAGPRFMPTSSFRPRNADILDLYVIDSRHGRVLLSSSDLLSHTLAVWVWDPISGDRLELPKLPAPQRLLNLFWIRWNAAVLCASNPSCGCDGIDCHLGHFLVVLAATSPLRAYVYVYSSQTATWSEATSAALDPFYPEYLTSWEEVSALAGNALYFKFFTRQSGGGILRYDLGMQEISWINLPSNCRASEITFTTTEHGGLGIARVESSSRLHLWSWEAGPGRHLGWAPSRVIELNTMLPANTQSIRVIAFLHGLGAILVSTNDGIFRVDLDSDRARKICEERCHMNVVPFMCFCTPAPDMAPTNTGEGPGASVQCA